MAATFTRMDESTAEQWAVIGEETRRNQPRVADRVLMLLESLRDVTDGFATDQLTHCLQTATLAELAGADDEVIVASLCHDIGKAISVPNHGAIAAEMLKPYVRPDVYRTILHHQDFQGRHYYQHFGGDVNARDQYEGEVFYDLVRQADVVIDNFNHFGMPTDLREKYREEDWFALCEQFTDDWDQVAFDPDGHTEPLSHFEPLVREVFSRVRY